VHATHIDPGHKLPKNWPFLPLLLKEPRYAADVSVQVQTFVIKFLFIKPRTGRSVQDFGQAAHLNRKCATDAAGNLSSYAT
jgi:hypothetical protein